MFMLNKVNLTFRCTLNCLFIYHNTIIGNDATVFGSRCRPFRRCIAIARSFTKGHEHL
jgi:hypothetical protein